MFGVRTASKFYERLKMKLEIKIDENGKSFVELPQTTGHEIKPGRKTSEAVATLVAMLAAVAVAKGWLTPVEADATTGAITELVGAISVVVIPALYTLYRTMLKLAASRRSKATCVEKPEVK
jgi:hypothetical protein